jgi:hypothetical protein
MLHNTVKTVKYFYIGSFSFIDIVTIIFIISIVVLFICVIYEFIKG